MKRHFLLLPITLLSLSLASCGMQESSSDRDSSYVAKSAAQNETMAVSEAKSYDTYDGSAAGSALITLTRGAKEGQKLVTTVSLEHCDHGSRGLFREFLDERLLLRCHR